MSRTRAADKAPADADPEFLALTERQRAAIDRVFARGVARSSGRKKRRLNKNTNTVAGPSGTARSSPTADAGGFVTDDAGGGGFVDDRFEGEGGFMDAGGFMPEDDGAGAGGFMPGGEDDEGGGGFMDDTSGDQASGRSSTNPETPKARIPLRLIPSLLSALKLPFDDDVLGVFRASASGWQDDEDDEGGAGPSRRRRPQETEDGVELKDFRAVCAALMGPDDGADFDLGDDPEPTEDAADMSSDEDEDMYKSESDSALSSLSSDSEFGAKRPAKRPGRRAKGKSAASTPGRSTPDRSERATSKPGKRLSKKAVALQAASGNIKLSSRQKDGVRDIWEMLKPEATGRGSHILGRDQVKKWVRDLGEMWTDDEITDMVKLFSSQHEGRGLSYDDFGIVMARAGLV